MLWQTLITQIENKLKSQMVTKLKNSYYYKTKKKTQIVTIVKNSNCDQGRVLQSCHVYIKNGSVKQCKKAMVEVKNGLKIMCFFEGENNFKSGLEKGMLEGMTRYTGQHQATAEDFGF